MATRRNPPTTSKTTRPPATTPQGRENQLISLSYDVAEKQLRDGTASSQVVTHFLKMGSDRERLEKERLAMEQQLMASRIDQIKSAQRVEELMGEALRAMKSYSGQEPEEEDDEVDY